MELGRGVAKDAVACAPIHLPSVARTRIGSVRQKIPLQKGDPHAMLDMLCYSI